MLTRSIGSLPEAEAEELLATIFDKIVSVSMRNSDRLSEERGSHDFVSLEMELDWSFTRVSIN